MKKVVEELKLSKEELSLENELTAGEYVSDRSKLNREMWEEAVVNYREMRKSKRMTMRVDVGDWIKVKARARQYSMPYQTLLKIVFKQFAEGKIAVKVYSGEKL